MKKMLKLAIPLMVITAISGAGCSSSKLSKIDNTNQKQQDRLEYIIEQVDRNASIIMETQSELKQINQRLTDLENRANTTQTDESATTQEIKENLAFLTDQLSRIDKSIQTPRLRPLPRGETVFKPGGFDVRSSYETARSDYEARRYEAAISGFKEVLTVSPASTYADNAQYWIGECYDALGNNEQALAAFNKVFNYEKSNKIPDAHVKIGIIYVKMGKTDLAREELQAVVDNYPDTNAAKIASVKLNTLGQ